jgi:nicotinate-nucleotide adenylyltransferase
VQVLGYAGAVQHIGIYGGSFDPVHNGHLMVAQAAYEEVALNRLFLVPAAQSPFKQDSGPTSGAIRAQMLRLAVADRPWCEVDEQEIRRGGVSYAVDTVRNYAASHPGAKLHYLIGADNVAGLPEWRAAAELAQLVEFVVIPRPGLVTPAIPAPFRGRMLRGWPMEVSSSEIRDRVKAGRTIMHLVPAPVAETILNNRLYL